MPKFKVGDKIEFEMDGKKVSGTITRDYNSPDHAMYDVRVGTKTMTIADTPMHPANACKNANFKVGDKVRIKNPNRQIGQDDGTYEVTLIRPDGMISVKAPSEKVGFAVRPEQLIANARAFNGKFKVGDKVWVPAKQKRGVIRGVSATGNQYDIEFMGGGGAYVNEEGLELLQALGNSVCNAIKVGDKVRVKGWQGIWEVTKTPPGMLEVKSDDGFVGITQVEKATPVKGANACRNASFKVGDKVTYWVFDKKLDGSVKAVRGERVDIDDGHGGVVTFKAKDLEVWNARACNAKFIKGDFVKVKGWPGTFRIDIVNPDGTYVLKKYPSGQPTIGSYKESELELEEANAKACNSRNPIVAKALNACGTAKNAVTITLDSRKRDGWVTGKVNGYDFEAKVFDEGSDFGIKSGRVSKLWMRKGDETVNYDRGWDERPKSAEAKAAYTELLRKMESLPKVMNACGTARNAKFIGRPPARVKQLIEQMEKILEVTDPNDTTDRMMGEVSSLGWSWDDSRRAWVYDDTDIKTDIKWAFKKFLEAVNRSDLEKAVDNISDKAMANDFKGMLKIAQKYAR